MASRSFGSQSPEIPHLSKGELADLRKDIDAGFVAAEVELDALRDPPVIGGLGSYNGKCIIPVSLFPITNYLISNRPPRTFTGGKEYSTVIVNEGTESALKFVSGAPGTYFNESEIETVDSGSGGLQVTEDWDTYLVIDLGGTTPTVQDIVALLASSSGWWRAVYPSGTPTNGLWTVHAPVFTAGGTGLGTFVYAGGEPLPTKVNLTNAEPLSVRLTGLTQFGAKVVGDTVGFQVIVDGLWSNMQLTRLAADPNS